MRTVLGGLANQLVIQPLTIYYLWPVFVWFGSPSPRAPLPGFYSLAGSYLVCVVFNEVFFYTSHRILHTRALYSKFHKQVLQISQAARFFRHCLLTLLT